MSLAVKYRPTELSEVIGQSTVIKILNKQLKTGNINNCYLFAGPSGTGKTTLARILANKVNDGNCNPIEIDGASNNGVDNVRLIINGAYERSLTGKYKVYIIDECHQITTAGWNAFLKCIEEPPKYTIFIFCTTDPQKLPETIKNRVMTFTLNRVNYMDIKVRLDSICEAEGYTNYSSTTNYLSRSCNGCVRQAISNLEMVAQSSVNGDLDRELPNFCQDIFDIKFDMVNAFIDHDTTKMLEIIEYLNSNVSDINVFVEQLISFTLDLTKYCVFKSTDALAIIPQVYEDKILYTTGVSDNQDGNVRYFNLLLKRLNEIKQTLKYDSDPKTTFQVLCLGVMNEGLHI